MVVVPNRMTNKLIEKGLMRSDYDDGSWAHVSADGFRAIADALDNGKIDYPKSKLAGEKNPPSTLPTIKD